MIDRPARRAPGLVSRYRPLAVLVALSVTATVTVGLPIGPWMTGTPAGAITTSSTDVDLITNVDIDVVAAAPGDTLTYTVTVENRGPADATNVTWDVNSAAAEATTLASPVCVATGGATCPTTFTEQALNGGHGYSEIIPLIPADGTVTLTFTSEAQALAGVYPVTATVSPTENDSVPETNSVVENVTVAAEPVSVRVDKTLTEYRDDTGTVVASPALAGSMVYQVVVTNDGVGDLVDHAWRDYLSGSATWGDVTVNCVGSTGGAVCPPDATRPRGEFTSSSDLARAIALPSVPGRTWQATVDPAGNPSPTLTFEVIVPYSITSCSTATPPTQTLRNTARLWNLAEDPELATISPYGAGSSSDNISFVNTVVPVPPCPAYDVATTISQASASLNGGDAFEYTVTVTNTGDDVTDVDFTFELYDTDRYLAVPGEYLSYFSIDDGSVGCVPSGGATCPTAYTYAPQTDNGLQSGRGNLPDLAAVIPSIPDGGQVTFTITGTMGDRLCGGTDPIRASAYALAYSGDGDSVYNTSRPSSSFEGTGTFYGNNMATVGTGWVDPTCGTTPTFDLENTVTGPYLSPTDTTPIVGPVPVGTQLYFKMVNANTTNGDVGIDFAADLADNPHGYTAYWDINLNLSGSSNDGLTSAYVDLPYPADDYADMWFDFGLGAPFDLGDYDYFRNVLYGQGDFAHSLLADNGFTCTVIGTGSCPSADAVLGVYDWSFLGYNRPYPEILQSRTTEFDVDDESLVFTAGSSHETIIPIYTQWPTACEDQAYFDSVNSGSNIFTGKFYTSINEVLETSPTGPYYEESPGSNNYSNALFTVEIPRCEDLPITIDKNVLGEPATTGEVTGPVTYEVIMSLQASATGALDVAQFTDITEVLCYPSGTCGTAPVVSIDSCAVTAGTATCPPTIPIGPDGTVDVSWGTPGATDVASGAAFEPGGEIRVEFTVAPSGFNVISTSLDNTATFGNDATSTDTTPTTVEDTVLLSIPSTPYMNVQKGVVVADVDQEATVTYNVEVANLGEGDGTGAIVSDVLPAALTADNPTGYSTPVCTPLTTSPPMIVVDPSVNPCDNITITNTATGWQAEMTGPFPSRTGFSLEYTAIAPSIGTSYKNTAVLDPPVGFNPVVSATANVRTPDSLSLGSATWIDANEDGIQDPGELPLAGSVVELLVDDGTGTFVPAVDIFGNPVTAVTTGADGLYFFEDLPPGDYQVQVTPPAGYAPSPVQNTTADDDTENDSNIATSPTAGVYLSPTFSLTAGGEPNETTGLDGDDQDDLADINGNMTIDFGFIEPASLGDYVWDDANADGIQDSTEVGVENVTVTLDPGTPGDPSDDLTTTTDATGFYEFTDLAPGDYTVTFTQPPSTGLSPTGATTSDLDSNGLTTTVTLASGDNDDTIDLGLIPLAGIGDFVWDDLNGDGIQDAGEPGIEGVAVTLDPGTPGDPSDDVTTTTDVDGAYFFEDLADGTYTVTFTPPAGMDLSPTTVGTDTTVDSNGLTTTVTVAAGEIDDTIDLGVYTPASVGDYVWLDANLDGIQDAGEVGVESVTVTLDPGTPGDPSDDVTTTTDATGFYEFTDLAPGDYTVTFTQPGGYLLSPTTAGTDTTVDSNGLTTSVTLESGDNDDTIDLGLYQAATIGDLVWDDLNADGVQDPGEPGIEGVMVTLDPGTPGDPTDDVTTTTDASGAYEFTDLEPGDYTVTFFQPTDTTLSPTTVGTDPAVDSNGLTTTVTVASGENNDTIDLGIYTAASVGDYVWEDANADGIQDPTEVGIEGVTVTLDPGTPGDPSDDVTTTTDATGFYEFTDLAPGDYTVTFTPPAGSTLSPELVGTDTAVDSNGLITTVTLDSGENNDTIDLGVYTPITIGDLVWDDLNGDGIQDPGEPGIEGVTVTLDPGTPADPSDDVTTTTDASGAYEFADLDPGTYTVTFTPPADTTLSPTTAGTDTAVDSNGLTTTVTLASGEADDTIDLGVYSLASVGDFVWDDLNGDGIQDAGEPGIENVTVTLDPGTPADPTDDLTTTTDATGFYGFTDLDPGDYTVTFTPPAGMDVSPTAAGIDTTVDSNGLTTTVTLESGDNNDTIDLGLYTPVTIGDFVWDDLNGDGIQDASEVGVENVTVTLDPGTPGDPTDDVTTTTDADGAYEFTDLAPGEYTVTFTQPAGTTVSPTNTGTDTTVDSNGLTTTVTLESGDNDDTIDLGIYTSAGVGDYVWADLNEDGIQDAGEVGIEGVTVTLDPNTPGDPSDDLTTTTDATGFYEFTGLVPGDYTVTFTQPASTLLSPTGTTTSDLDSNGLTTSVNLSSGEYDDTIDVGIIELVGLGDLVWDDLNGDGIQDAGEPGIEGVTVTLDPGTPGDPSDDVTTTTDVDGFYEFADLDPGTYTVTFTPPAGMDLSPTTAGADPTADSNGLITTVTLASGENDPTIDLGLYTPVTIGDLVWDDLNGDGIQDPGEPGIENVTVTLDPGTPGDPTDDVTTTTDADGLYEFTDLAPGDYTVTFTQPADTALSPTTAGTDTAVDSNGLTTTVTLESGDNNDTIDLGVYTPVTIGDLVWDDLNGDGIQDTGEPGIENVTVTLDPGTPGDPTDDVTTTTDATGFYEFTDLAPGTYTVTFDQPAGTTLSPTNTGTDTTVDSNGLSTTVTLASGESDDTIDLGVYNAAAISGQVWIDAPVGGTVDGEQALGESAVEAVTVTLDPGTPGDPSDDLTTTTDATGYYEFTDLAPGEYTVTFTQPDGYSVTTEDPAVGSTVNNDGLTTAVTLESGIDITDIDLGLIEVSSLAGTVYHDEDLSGDLGVETGIEGVTITLTGTDVTGAAVSLTTTTGPDGTYLFEDVVPGDYTVTETQPGGWFDSETTAGSEGGTAVTNEVSGVTLPPGTDATDYDFGEVQPASIAGTVFVDANYNGADDGEIGIEGVTITLSGTDNLGNTVTATATTDANGNYIFENLPPGDYTVIETQPALWIDGLATSSGSEGGTFSSTEIADIPLGSGVNAVDYDFGELTPSPELTLTKTADPDPSLAGDLMTFTLAWSNDGNIDVTGATLTETVPAGSVFASSTDAWSCVDGDPAGTICTLSVVDMAPGDTGTATFTVRIDNPLPTGSQASLPNTAVINGDAQDPNGVIPVGTSGTAEPVLESTQISGVVYHQTDPTDPTGDVPLGGATVALLDAAGDPVINPATGEPWVVEVGADGTYLFDGLAPGDYTVVETTPSGYGDADGYSSSVVVSPAIGAPATQDFWHTTSSIVGTVYVDEDLDGDLTAGEQPLAGVTVTLTGTDVNGNPVEMSTTTDENGDYVFDGLLAGDYTVTESQPTLWANGSTDAGDNGGTTSEDDDIVADIALPVGTDATGYNFGEVGNPVGGTVFFDGSGDPIEGVTVTLVGTDVFGNPVELTTTTGPDGTYLFEDIYPGEYTLTQTQPGAYTSGTVAPTNEIPISVSGTPNLGNDFSEEGATISGEVTESVDGTGDPSVTDPGIAGVTVTLTGTDIDGNPVEMTTVTDADGNYQFADLPAGTYTVTEIQPDDYSNVATIAGSNGGETDGNDDVITEIVIGPGEDATGYDFNEAISGISGVVTIEGTDTPIAGVEVTLYDENGDVVAITTTDENGVYVFPDVLAGTYTVVQSQPNGYGTVTENELTVEHGTTGTSDVDFVETAGVIEGEVTVDGDGGTISGVTITLTGTDVNGNPVTMTTVTDEQGQYRFEELLAGTYTVTETQPDAYSNGAIEPDNVIEVTLEAGQTSSSNNFSEQLTDGAITGVVYEDGTNNPISGVIIRLLDENGNEVATTTTNASGVYVFSNLPPGSYTIQEVQPDGYDAGAVRPQNTQEVTLEPSGSVTGIDFSEAKPNAGNGGSSNNGSSNNGSSNSNSNPVTSVPYALAATGAATLTLLIAGGAMVASGGVSLSAGRRGRRRDDADND